MHEIGHFGERVTAHREPHADPRFAKLDVLALVDERVIDPAIGPLDARLFEDAVGPEVDGPVRPRARFRDRARDRRFERCTRLILRHIACETIDRAVGLEAHAQLRRFARLEQPHLPAIGRIQLARQQSRKRRFAPGLQLDVILRRAVVRERSSATRLRRDQMQSIGNRAGSLERLLARHLHVEIDKRERFRKITPCEHGRDRRQDRKRDPERGPLRDSAHRRCLIGRYSCIEAFHC